MERAPPPALAAAALAAMDEAFMDTPLSPKRPRQDDPPDQVGARASVPRPDATENRATKACMLATTSMQATHTPPSTTTPSTPHTQDTGHSNQ
mmetsp:Transcript_116985/g.162586  ORF Transcript_116985/g.162586 Transcript_116985/m.162586 type:complete len:93 (+) Transcript_116985:236-514(+)